MARLDEWCWASADSSGSAPSRHDGQHGVASSTQRFRNELRDDDDYRSGTDVIAVRSRYAIQPDGPGG